MPGPLRVLSAGGHSGEQSQAPQKSDMGLPRDPALPPLGTYAQRPTALVRRGRPPRAPCGGVCRGRGLEAARWASGETALVHTPHGLSLSRVEPWGPTFVTTRTALDGVVPGEISQIEKDKHRRISLVCGNEVAKYTNKAKRNKTSRRDTESRVMVAGGEGPGRVGEGGLRGARPAVPELPGGRERSPGSRDAAL